MAFKKLSRRPPAPDPKSYYWDDGVKDPLPKPEPAKAKRRKIKLVK